MNADEYRKLAEVEDRMWYFRALHRHIERELAALLGDGAAAVLDAGCGTGGLILRLAARHPRWRWTGVDVSDLAVALARQRLAAGPVPAGGMPPRVELASVTGLPQATDTVDAIVSADVLYHVDDDVGALREFVRVLRPGGVVVLNVPAYQWLWSYHDVAVHSKRRYDRGEVIAKLRSAGLAPVRVTYWNSLPFPLVVARRKLLLPPREGSDVHLFPGPVERAFDIAMALERGWLRMIGPLPFGTSVFAVARKP